MCARVEHLLGMHELAHERLVRALDELPEHACDHCVSLMVELSVDPVHRMDYAAMPEWGDRAAELAVSASDDAVRAVGLAAAARAAAFAGAGEAAEARRAEAAALVDRLPDADLARRLDAAMYLAGAELYLHRFADTNAHSARLLRVGRATGQGQLFPLVTSTLGISWYLMGRLREAIDPLDGAVEAARLTGNAQNLAWSLYPRAKVALAMGDVGAALSLAQEACDLVDDGRPSHHLVHAAFALGEAFLEAGNPAPALELLERSAGGPDMPLTAPSYTPWFLELLTRCRLAAGDIDAAERAARVAHGTAVRTGLPLARAWADRALAAVALAREDAAAAAGLALGAAELSAQASAPIEAALCRALGGRARAAAGDRDGGVEHLRRAAAELEALGALRYRDAAERELRRLGHRVQRRPQATGEGVGGLTARELEIARRIVDRRTNRQIAEELFLSPKTVETHIRNIFVKLGAGSRVEVARIVERADRLETAK
jgi:DNA-binding CsgD family transcriptional regulator